MSTRIISLLLVAFVIVAGGDYLTKRWTSGHGQSFLWTAWICYFVVSGIWFLVIAEKPEIGRIGVIWTTCALLASVLIGTLVFNEHLPLTNKLGVLLCIFGVILTSL